jgi:hypothetical protein
LQLAEIKNCFILKKVLLNFFENIKEKLKWSLRLMKIIQVFAHIVWNKYESRSYFIISNIDTIGSILAIIFEISFSSWLLFFQKLIRFLNLHSIQSFLNPSCIFFSILLIRALHLSFLNIEFHILRFSQLIGDKRIFVTHAHSLLIIQIMFSLFQL